MIRLVKNKCTLLLILLIISCSSQFIKKQDENYFLGKYFAGEGDIEYLELLDIARRMFGPDPEFQNLPMFYEPKWNGFIEGPTWDAWWIQNSYGPTYCSLPFLTEPYITFLQNSQDLWFDQIGDGKTEYTYHNHTWIPPDGCLVDAAKPDWAAHKQGDGRVELHDWALEFTAAGALLQAELLLISRDIEKIEKYLPKLERGVNFIETRRDPAMNLFLAGPAGNLLAPSYAGWKKSDGIFDKAYLSGLSITYIAVLDRIIELEKMIQNEEKVMVYENRRHMAQKGLPLLIAEDGCFIKSLDPDGTKHGVFGAEKHGYFDTVCNHDAICFRVVDDTHARIIYDRIVAIPELRQNNTIITNYPSLDDMYVNNKGLFNYGTWVNGGNWSTCEARMIMSYYRLNVFEDARKSMQQLLTFAEKFRMDNPFTNFGSGLNQPNKHINLVYDSFGPPAAFVRGLFEYIYKADELILYPHIPSGISYVEQRFPVRFGEKKLFLSTVGTGKITKVMINGNNWRLFDEMKIILPYDKTPENAVIQIAQGNSKKRLFKPQKEKHKQSNLSSKFDNELVNVWFSINSTHDPFIMLPVKINKLCRFYNKLKKNGFENTYEATHAKLAVKYFDTIFGRYNLKESDKLNILAPQSQLAADNSYLETALNLCNGLETVVNSYENSNNNRQNLIYKMWINSE